MLAKANVISCNFSTLPLFSLRNQRSQIRIQTPNVELRKSPQKLALASCNFLTPLNGKTCVSSFRKKNCLQIRHSSLNPQNLEDPDLRKEESGGGGDGNGGEERNWTGSILLFALWSALMYYVFFLSPNQTPVW